MALNITASNDTLIANTFQAIDPQPFEQAEPRVVSEQTNQLSGFISQQDRVTITPEAQAKAQAQQQISETEQAAKASSTNNSEENQEAPSNEFIQVSSSIGRASSSGNLKREEAMAIYQKIASLL